MNFRTIQSQQPPAERVHSTRSGYKQPPGLKTPNPIAVFHRVGLAEIIGSAPIMLKMQATLGRHDDRMVDRTKK